MSILYNGFIAKQAQPSHEIGNVKSRTISDILKAASGAHKFILSYDITNVLQDFNTWVIWEASKFKIIIFTFIQDIYNIVRLDQRNSLFWPNNLSKDYTHFSKYFILKFIHNTDFMFFIT